MAELSDAQRKRAEAREQRRGRAAPADDDGGKASGSSSGEEPAHHGVKQAAKVAAGAAAVGAAAAAARALTSQNDEEPPDEQAEAGEAEEPEQPGEPEPTEQDQDAQNEQEQQPVEGSAASDARRVIDRGREQLQDLLGRPVESVSSLERTHDGWVLALEVVELSRIPESTDVLASYEMELDGDLNLRRYQQGRRYHRGRADRGEDA